jgi:hypothetical protein
MVVVVAGGTKIVTVTSEMECQQKETCIDTDGYTGMNQLTVVYKKISKGLKNEEKTYQNSRRRSRPRALQLLSDMV